MDSQRESKACEAILQAVGQRSQLIPEVLDTINETWTKTRGEEFVSSLSNDKDGRVEQDEQFQFWFDWHASRSHLLEVQNWKSLLQNWTLPELQSKLLAMQLKSSRNAEKGEYSAYADLRNRVETSQASKKEVLTSIGEDIRAVSRNTEFLRFLLAMIHTEIQYDRIWTLTGVQR